MKAGDGSTLIKNKKKRDNKGTTMVTVVVSFALLMIFVTGFYKVQKVSQNIMMDSKDILVNNRELIKAFYLGETNDNIAAENVRLSFSGDEGSFYIDADLYRAEKEGLTGTVYYYGSKEE